MCVSAVEALRFTSLCSLQLSVGFGDLAVHRKTAVTNRLTEEQTR